MRNAALMTVGIVVAIGAAFAVPAMSDGPANYKSSADTSAYLLGDEDHGEYVQRQTDGDVSRDLTARDHAYGYENGVCLPSFVALKEEEIEYVCNTIKEFYHGK